MMHIISHVRSYKQQRLLMMANTSLCDYILTAFFTSYLADRETMGAEERGNKCQQQATEKPKKVRG